MIEFRLYPGRGTQCTVFCYMMHSFSGIIFPITNGVFCQRWSLFSSSIVFSAFWGIEVYFLPFSEHLLWLTSLNFEWHPHLNPALIVHSIPSQIFSPRVTAGIVAIAKWAKVNLNPLSVTSTNWTTFFANSSSSFPFWMNTFQSVEMSKLARSKNKNGYSQSVQASLLDSSFVISSKSTPHLVAAWLHSSKSYIRKEEGYSYQCLPEHSRRIIELRSEHFNILFQISSLKIPHNVAYFRHKQVH